MGKINGKIFTILGTTVIIAMPISAVINCGANKSNEGWDDQKK